LAADANIRSRPAVVKALASYRHQSAGHQQLPVDYEVRDWRFQYRGVYRHRDRQPGTDLDVCFSGRIAVTQLVPSPSR